MLAAAAGDRRERRQHRRRREVAGAVRGVRGVPEGGGLSVLCRWMIVEKCCKHEHVYPKIGADTSKNGPNVAKTLTEFRNILLKIENLGDL